MDFVNHVVIPGDNVTSSLKAKKDMKIIIGPGLRREADNIFSVNGGILKKKEPNTYYVDSHRRRYIPERNELVIGIVINKAGDYFKVDIGSSEAALLSYLAFERATKKNRVKLDIGDIVYAKLLTANRDMEPELVCINSQGKGGIMGVLSNDGYLFTCSINLARKLLNPQCPFSNVGETIPHEITVGINGRIWLKAPSVKTTISLSKAILACEYLSFDEIRTLCDKLKKGYTTYE